MTRKPAIVTDGWPEVSDSLAKTGLFQEDQLNPEIVLRALSEQIGLSHLARSLSV